MKLGSIGDLVIYAT